jgi:hypothetical protein
MWFLSISMSQFENKLHTPKVLVRSERIAGCPTGGYEEFCLLGYKPCSWLKVNLRFWGTHRLNLQCRRGQARNQRESRWRWFSTSVYSSTLMMEATYSSETSVCFQRTALRYIQNDRTLPRKVKYEVHPILNWAWRHDVWGVEVYLRAYLTSALHEGEWPPLCARYLLDAKMGGPQNLSKCDEKEIHAPTGNWTSISSIVQPIA